MPCSIQAATGPCSPPSTTWLRQTQTSQGRSVRQRTDECHPGLYKKNFVNITAHAGDCLSTWKATMAFALWANIVVCPRHGSALTRSTHQMVSLK